ncbi:hypothetical protein [Leptospira levettii]|uniref:hypothetical protein n=1 Tax=Leptospira levettii TaxID=2023178 RepID=UPI001082EE7D|nr:hypothetical protein [Leptospira levettii]MCW7507895.1 hypothetical protein [Leptospira levettii]MCW7518985.1 hypothetical protein [Leptospira levettii]TGK98669.1 hypothetical protein EHQ34_10430 [Leptospira levettii]TGL25387.1 hypothetical protein EHQ42_01205 [Leptospira levettii]
MNWKEKLSYKLVILISAISFGTFHNCIAFVKYENPLIEKTPKPEFKDKKIILVKYYGDQLKNGKYSTDYRQLNWLQKDLVEKLNESNLFKKVITDEKEAYDYVMYYESDINDQSSSVLFVLSALTFMIIPFNVNLDYDIKISLYDSKNVRLTSKQEKINANGYAGWLLIPISPLYFIQDPENKALENILNNALNDWKLKGFIK